ncbi:pleckstrin homology domain-containing family A member 7-like isoform X3 [Mobula birostris]|uniref:pleckstrin homology domain-containing family A member 7-like isoform X3 n=1 Tax=Mobula birostris TaxID=1983395 RepID=UPI003B28CE12
MAEMSEIPDRPQSEVSQGSSIGNISSLSTPLGSKPIRPMKKVHTFGKREQAIRRDPNSVTVIRGWLYKQDSSGLKLWKRRWFVLSDFCLFYYRDSREERILGSILMPSYTISAIDPQDRKARKFAFKAEHPGMRTYYFSADTQEDMNGWMRAMSQSARAESEFASTCLAKSSKPAPQDRRYSSYKDLTEPGLQQYTGAQSAESLEIANLSQPDPWDKMQEKEPEPGRLEPQVPADRHKAAPSLTISLDRVTPPARNGAVPPPTPTSAFQSMVFGFEGNSRPEDGAVEPLRKTSLSHVEQWVQSQKEELAAGDEEEQYLVTTQSGHVYECLIDGYPISSVNSQLHPGRSTPIGSSRQRVPSEAGLGQGEKVGGWSGEERGWQPVPAAASPSPEVGCRQSITSYRSNSLPATSETPRYQVLHRTLTPDDRYTILLAGQRGRRLAGGPSERASRGSLERSASPLSPPASLSPLPGWSARGRDTLEVVEASSPDEFYHSALSHSSHRSVTRPHTPVGRIDVLPSQLPVGNGYLQIPQLMAGTLRPPPSPAGDRPWDHYMAASPASIRGQAQSRHPSRPQTPAGRFDVLPSEDHFAFPSGRPHSAFRSQQRSPGPVDRMTLGAPEERDHEGLTATLPSRCYRPSPRPLYRSHSPVDRAAILPRDHSSDRSLCRLRPPPHRARYPPPLPVGSGLGSTLRLSAARGTSSSYSQLPPRPPPSPRACLSPLVPSVRRLSIAHSINGGAPEIFQEFPAEPVRMAESEVDVLLTRLCGQDRILQGLVAEATPLKAEKDRLERALDAIRCQLLDFGGQQAMAKKLTCQQRILQEELIQTRARLCDLSLEMEQAWSEYEFLENELERLRAPRELMGRCGSPQERGEAQRDLSMMQDVMLGLLNNKKNFQVAIESTRHPAASFSASPVLDHRLELQRDSPRRLTPLPSPSSRQLPALCASPPGEDDVPCRPPLPHMPYHEDLTSVHVGPEAASLVTLREHKHQPKDVQSEPVTNGKGDLAPTTGGTGRRGKMSAEEQKERMKRHLQARGQDRAKTGRMAQRGVVVSPVVRAPLTEQKAGAPGLQSRTPLTKRPQTSHVSGAQLATSVLTPRSSPRQSPIAIAQAAAMETAGTPNVVTSSKLVTKISAPPARVDSQERENSRVIRRECKVAMASRYIHADPDPPQSPEQRQGKQQTQETVKTVITKTSPGVAGSWPPSDRATHLGEGERHRIVSLSFALATEACQRRKVMAAKTLAELQKWDEVTESQRVTNRRQSDNGESDWKTPENVLILAQHKATANPNSGCRQESANPNSGQEAVVQGDKQAPPIQEQHMRGGGISAWENGTALRSV